MSTNWPSHPTSCTSFKSHTLSPVPPHPSSLQTHKQPVTEYEAIREKLASQKRDVERALTRFVAKTGPTQSLFADQSAPFPREHPPVVLHTWRSARPPSMAIQPIQKLWVALCIDLPNFLLLASHNFVAPTKYCVMNGTIQNGYIPIIAINSKQHSGQWPC